MFSSRTAWSTLPNALSRALDARRARGQEVLDLTESNPTRLGFGPAPAVLAAALAHPDAARYEPHPFGLAPAREAVARYLGTKGCDVPPSQIALTSSTSEAYAFLFKLLADPGDTVLVPRPSYPLFDFLADLESVRTVAYPLSWDGEWHLVREELERLAMPSTRAVVAVSPNNPTGSFLKKDELAFVTAFCRERGLALIADEVFSDYAFAADDPRRVRSVVGSGGCLSFALSGLSKVALAPQLKLSWIAASGPEPELSTALARLEVISDTFLSTSSPAQLAAPALLDGRRAAQDALRTRLSGNLATVQALCLPGSAWQPLAVEGGWTLTLRLPRARTEEAWALALLEEDGVLVHPGYFYDFPSEAFVCLSLMPEPSVFSEGVVRVARRVAAG